MAARIAGNPDEMARGSSSMHEVTRSFGDFAAKACPAGYRATESVQATGDTAASAACSELSSTLIAALQHTAAMCGDLRETAYVCSGMYRQVGNSYTASNA